MCAALWTRNLAGGLPAATAPLPVEMSEVASPATRSVETSDAASPTPRSRPGTSADPRVWWLTRDTPFGAMHVAASPAGVCAVSLAERGEQFVARLARGGVTVAPADAALEDEAASAARVLLEQAGRQLEEYFAGKRRDFDVPLDLSRATVFDRRVLAAMAAIPYGETRSYGELARTIGSPGASRAVGHACGRNPVPLLLPCHRVVRSDGSLAGFGAGGVGVKAALLALERREAAC
jgi:methylated-DNA-[protein]-cysteine S-methyltransferase